MEKIIFHIDVNNAFLSWTAVDYLKKRYKVDLRETYAVIGGDEKTRKGVVLAKSPLAKKCGVITGEPIYQARKKCPNLVVYPPNFKLYHEQSCRLRDILAKYSDNIEPFSIDEAFMEYVPLFGTYMEVAKKIQKEVYDTLGFTVNIGISTNKLLAKMASDFEKPNKIHTLFKEEIESKMWPLPVHELLFLGKSSAKKLNDIGIKTIYDLAHANVDTLEHILKSHGRQLYEYANGIDNSAINSEATAPKSISNSVTLEKDLANEQEILPEILLLCDKTATRLRQEKMKCKTVTITLKTNYFKVYSSSHTISQYTDITKELLKVCKEIFYSMYTHEPLRLVGVGLSNLQNIQDTQISLFDTENSKQSKVDKTVDSILNKYGNITRASLIHRKTRK